MTEFNFYYPYPSTQPKKKYMVLINNNGKIINVSSTAGTYKNVSE